MKLVSYTRCSTAEQGRSGLGLAAQETAIDQYVSVRDATVIASFREVASGKRDDRPELAKAIRHCQLSGATLVVAKLDRLSRSIRFVAELRESEVEFVFADMPDANTLTIGVMSSMAQHEREIISARTKAGLAEAKARGVKLGNPLIAEIGEKTMTAARVAHVAKAAKRNASLGTVIAELEADHGEGMTLKALADALNGLGLTTARGKSFTATTVMRIKRATEAAA